jgi:hypothetical protein
MDDIAEVRAVTVLDGFNVRLEFTDDTTRTIDLDRYLHGPIFAPLRDDPHLFRSATVQDGTISWPNGADIDPEVLYYDLGPDATEDAWRAARAASALTPRP